jgi:hypothetical protein
MNKIKEMTYITRYISPWELFLNFDKAENKRAFQTWLEEEGMEAFKQYKEVQEILWI